MNKMNIGLCMIVKNESHIIVESLECTLPLISTYCIVDTGSSDNTIEIITNFYKKKGIKGTVYSRPWKNFGHNRSEALSLCNRHMDYALVIDADDTIEFPQNAINIIQTILETKPNACNILIKQETIEYWRSQIFKCNDGWRYVGVLHEYPENRKENNVILQLPRNIFMNSRRLGGRNLVGDKMKRDIAILLKGIADEPDNERYIFYLAQSYRDDGDNLNAIKYYKKRFKMGRWYEEAWFSAYQVGVCYRRLGDFLKFEYWMQKAHNFHPKRAEPLYHLTEHFRSTRAMHKAYEYCLMGLKIEQPRQDVLFVEKFPHNGGFLYEKAVLDYYVHDDKRIGLRDTFEYLLRSSDYIENVISNIMFYISPIDSLKIPLSILKVFGEMFRPSAISVYDYPHANIRFVNYLPPITGEYKTKDGSPVTTKNARYNLETNEYSIIEDSKPRFESPVRGLEDMRVYKQNNKLFYTASNYYEFLDKKISIVHGEYGGDPRPINSPINSVCEKNWLHIPNTTKFIYNWYPLQIGSIINDTFVISKKIETPPLFNIFRGSAVVRYNGNILALVHFCEYSKLRKYYHCFVELESETYNVIRLSLPFQFKGPGIEYCLSMRVVDDNIECYSSFCDSDLHKILINFNSLDWIQFSKESRIIRIPENLTVYWSGKYSECMPNGSIEKFVDLINTDKPVSFLFPQSDGIVNDLNYKDIISTTTETRILILPNSACKQIESACRTDTIPIICALSTRAYSRNNILLLPLDDYSFEHGVSHLFKDTKRIPWENKENKLFWRGNIGGYERPSIRELVVKKLFDNLNSNIRFAFFGDNGKYAKTIDRKYIVDRRSELQEYMNYKYLLIVDGVNIASNHQWTFESGSVPVMITHPDNNWWFKQYLKPMDNYVPINYDLSDLEEKLQWLVDNDGKAKQISENAMKLSREIFSSDFQKQYIANQIKSILTLN